MKTSEHLSSFHRLLIVQLVLSFILAGCATMFAPSHDAVTIKTDPEGAEVYDGVELLGKTPLSHTFKRDTFVQKVLQIKMAGYRTKELQLGRTLDNVSLWNFGYFLTTMGGTCWLIDASNGNMIKYAPDSYLIELERNGGSTRKDQSYRERLRFVILNHAELSRNIAWGDGSYLRAYFEMKAADVSSRSYEAFRAVLSTNARYLLSRYDPLDFFYALETNF